MGWFRKIVNVLIVVGVAALMSIPFKRVPPQTTSKSGERGEWELDRPGLPFKLGDILTGEDRPTTSHKPVIPATDAGDARGPESGRTESGSTKFDSPSGAPAPSSGDDSSSESLPALRDDDRRRPMSTMPRIEGQPARSERLEDQSPLPSLPADFQPLGDS